MAGVNLDDIAVAQYLGGDFGADDAGDAEFPRDDGRYFLLNEEGGVALLSLNYFSRGYLSDYAVSKGLMETVPDFICHFKGGYGWFYFEKQSFERAAERAFARLLADASFVKDMILPETAALGDRALALFRANRRRGFRVAPTVAHRLLAEFETIIARQISLNYIAVFDLKDQIYSRYLSKYLRSRLGDRDLKLSFVMEKLLAPEPLTYTQQLRIELLKLALAARRGAASQAALKRIWQDWQWLNYGYRGPVLDQAYFRQSLAELAARSVKTLQEELAAMQNYSRRTRAEKLRLYDRLGIDQKHRDLIDALSLLSYLKVYRKDTAFLLIYMTHEILEKFNPGLRRDNFLYLTLGEAAKMIDGRLDVPRRELAERERNCVFFSRSEKFIYGQASEAFIDKIAEKEEAGPAGGQLKLLEGMMACLGQTGDWVYGQVKVVNTPADMKKMAVGDILVSVATTPDILPAMKKAAAIVTDHGGITCHAAIVSRELNIPCLIATKYATKVFKDGDAVIVCPRHGYIKFQ